MSLLCRKSSGIFGLLVGIVVTGNVFAADGYFTPEITLSGERHTNVDLATNPVSDGSVVGYSALASGIFGLRTPRSLVELRPRIQFYDYPDRDELQRTNRYLDIRGQYDSPRSDWELVGSYWKQTAYEAQRIDAEYDEFDPNDPSVDTPSRFALLTEDRTRIQLRPTYTHQLSERIGVQFNGLYQTMRFDSLGISSNVDYDYIVATGSLLWAVGPRTRLATGVYGSKYDGENADQVDSKGVTVGLTHEWSQTFSGYASVDYERSDFDSFDATSGSSNDWGVEVGVARRGQVSQIRFDAGRTFSPSSAGSRTVLDQIRFQYSRNLTQRWTFLGALRAYRNRAQGQDAGTGDDRDYGSAYTQLSWNVTRTWSVAGGYSYYWRKYVTSPSDADDHVVTLGITYRGLRPQ